MWESILSFFALGAFGFWLVAVAAIILLCYFSEDNGVGATLTLVGGVFFLKWCVGIDALRYVKGNPLHFLLYAGIYVLAGLAWAVLKWWRYVAKRRRKYDAARDDYCRMQGIDPKKPIPLEQKKDWQNSIIGHKLYSAPQVTEHKGDIIRWMTYWPFSVITTLLNDPIRRLFEFIYETVGVKMQAISDTMFKGTKDDFLTEAEKKELAERADSKTEERERAKVVSDPRPSSAK